jgi:hypothetical protein
LQLKVKNGSLIFAAHQGADVGLNAANKIVISIIVIKDVKSNVLSALENVVEFKGFFEVGVEVVHCSFSPAKKCVLFDIKISSEINLDIWI